MWPDVLAGRKVPLLSGSYPIRLIVFFALGRPCFAASQYLRAHGVSLYSGVAPGDGPHGT